MKKLRLRSLALLLTLALLATMLPMSALAEGLDGGGESLEEALNVDTTYYEVAFALPDGLSEEEAAQIVLPEPVLLPADTLIYALAEPRREDYSFAGWYYDAALTQPADGGDAVTRNLTLYPSFAPIQNYDDEFRINYISNQEVAPDFPIEVVARGLSEDQLRGLLRVTNLDSVDGEEAFTLTRIELDLAALIPDEDLRARTRDILDQAGAQEGSLTGALSALTAPGEGEGEPAPALSEAVIAELVAYYAPEESAAAMESSDLLNRVKAAGLDVNNVTLAQLRDIATQEELAALDLPGDDLAGDGEDAAVDLGSLFEDIWESLPAAHYIVRPEGGKWSRGDMHQVEILDTDSLRFFRDGEETGKYIVYYNITVHQDDFNNMKLNSGVVFLPYAEVEGVTLDSGLFKADAENDSEEMTVTKNDDSGIMTYAGDEPLAAGVTVAVYDGALNADGTVDGSVGYFKITGALGDGRYAWESPDFTDVVFLPDIIPAGTTAALTTASCC